MVDVHQIKPAGRGISPRGSVFQFGYTLYLPRRLLLGPSLTDPKTAVHCLRYAELASGCCAARGTRVQLCWRASLNGAVGFHTGNRIAGCGIGIVTGLLDGLRICLQRSLRSALPVWILRLIAAFAISLPDRPAVGSPDHGRGPGSRDLGGRAMVLTARAIASRMPGR